jgi:transcription elongation factor GreA
MKQYYFTEKGYEKLKNEIDRLEKYIKQDISKEIAEAREHGDLRENAEYEAAKNKQANYMAKLGQLQERFTSAQIIRKEELPADTISLGKTVKIRDVKTGSELEYTILGEGETDIDKGIISYQSPLAKQLINHKTGDTVDVHLPRGVTQYEILSISFFED